MRHSGIVLFALIALSSPSAFAQPLYHVTDIGSFTGPSSAAYGINELGHVTGYASVTAQQFRHAVIYANGTLQDLGTLPGEAHSTGRAINIHGHVVGYNRPSSNFIGFYYDGSTMVDVGQFGGNWTQAFGINDFNQVVGYSNLPDGRSRAFLYENGTMTDLGSLNDDRSIAIAINNAGQITGYSTSGQGFQAFIFENGTMTGLGDFGSGFSEGAAINEQGWITGRFRVSVGGQFEFRAFIYKNGVTTDLGTFGAGSTHGRDINEHGDVVGTYMDPGLEEFGWVYTAGSRHDLNDLLAPASTGYTIIQAHGINDAGQIAAFGTNPNGDHRGFLLTPIPEPSSLLVLAGGSLAVAMKRRRRAKQA